MSDNSKIRAIREHLAAQPPPAGPGRTLAIDRCLDCPFLGSGRQAGMLYSYCREVGRVDRDHRTHLLPTAAVADGPPPDWCPLRAGPVTLEVRP